MDDHETGRASEAEGRSGHDRDLNPAAPGPRRLSDHTQMRIGHHLRAMYDTIVQQPVPDRFRDLIARMEEAAPTDRDEA